MPFIHHKKICEMSMYLHYVRKTKVRKVQECIDINTCQNVKPMFCSHCQDVDKWLLRPKTVYSQTHVLFMNPENVEEKKQNQCPQKRRLGSLITLSDPWRHGQARLHKHSYHMRTPVSNLTISGPNLTKYLPIVTSNFSSFLLKINAKLYQ
jgi:hypothetical protein